MQKVGKYCLAKLEPEQGHDHLNGPNFCLLFFANDVIIVICRRVGGSHTREILRCKSHRQPLEAAPSMLTTPALGIPATARFGSSMLVKIQHTHYA